MLLRPAHDFAGTHSTRLTRHLAPVHKKRQRGDAANLEARAQFLVGLGVNLGCPNTGLQLAGGLHKGRRHLPAGATPGRPKIDKDRNVAAAYVLFKGRLV